MRTAQKMLNQINSFAENLGIPINYYSNDKYLSEADSDSAGLLRYRVTQYEQKN